MGVVFGLASMWKASAFYVGAGDMIFSPVMSGKPLQSIVLSVVSRGLFGWIAGLLYSAVKRGRLELYPLSGGVRRPCIPLLPSVGFGLCENPLLPDPFGGPERGPGSPQARRHGISLSEESSYDILHLQIQFLMGMMSLAVLVMLLIILYQKNQSYLRYEARLDSLTGVLNRQQFFEKGEQLLKTMEPAGKQQSRCFIILDLDSFKEINDRYGHPAGDRVLRETADRLLYEAKKNGKNQFVMEEA